MVIRLNYYELLNIERNADANTVKRAYFAAVKIHTPDNDPEGFKAIRLAYETLSDKKKRSEYDSYFVMSGDEQDKLLAAREMIRENKYKQAADFLTGLIGDNLNSGGQQTLFAPEYPTMFYTEAKRLLAEVLWKMKKSGSAQKLCCQILEKNPSDTATLLLLAKISASMGHTDKAGKYYNDAVNADPMNPAIWIDYMKFAIKYARYLVPNVFRQAMEQDVDMFRDEYLLYIAGIYETDLFSDENISQYLDKFAEYFTADKSHDEEIYVNLINFVIHIIDREESIPFMEKILPVLEKSRYRRESDEKVFKDIRVFIMVGKLKSDKRIHDVLIDMTIFFLIKDTNKDELFGMEYYIVSKQPDLRPSIKVLMNDYPEFFKLNQAFYMDVLNEKKETYLIEKYIGIYKKLKLSSKNNFFYDDFDDDYETENTAPIIRSSPKVGRNDPCPCGSGKKYKKCCGR